MDKIEFRNEEKNMYLVSYRYKNKLHLYNEKQKWEYDNFVIKAKNDKSVHGYLDKFRQEFIDCGYEMEYSFQKLGEGNFIEI